MSKSQLATAIVGTAESPAEDVETLVATSNVQPLLDALDDADCRAILDAASAEPLSAKEVSETCDLPLSTAYRKLELLTGAGLLEEQTRICQSGKHASEYTRLVKRVTISLDTNGKTTVQVFQRDGSEHTEAAMSPTEDRD
ncbi:MAG: helix-turn-helix domain-containing protein [Haloarculaceae archaeon]